MSEGSHEEESSSNQLPYPIGEITKRLIALKAKQEILETSFDKLQPYRQAASVMVAINPVTLNPVGNDPHEDDSMALLQELIPSPYSQCKELFPLTLPVASRKLALKSLSTREAIMSAISANPIRPDTLLQNMFISVIQEEKLDISHLNIDELAAFSTIIDWLEHTDIAINMPSIGLIRQQINLFRDQERLLTLASESFTGRENEINLILSHLSSNEPRILLISGLGGIGKSALLSQALLSWLEYKEGSKSDKNSWVRIDLDHSLVEPERPSTILREAAKQLSRQYLEFNSIMNDFIIDASKTESRIDYSKLESSDSSDWAPLGHERLINQFIQNLKFVINTSNKKIAFWIDTFEEAQFLGRSVVETLLNYINDITCALPNIRVILSGRTPLNITTFRNIQLDHLPLGDLPQQAAIALLGKLIHKLNNKHLDVGSIDIAKTVRRLGGNPLTLQLAARVIVAEGKQSLINLGKIKKEVLQRQLYSRILEHIHNPDLHMLAIPGIIVRQITTPIIIQVLAIPSGLGQINENKAQQLMEEFGKEISLIEVDYENKSLRYRQDIRLLTLNALPREMNNVIRQIDELAVVFWQTQSGANARAEEIYHRLRLKQSSDQLAQRWTLAAAPLLRSTLDELPPQSDQYIWLAGMLNAVVDGSSLEIASQAEWEQQVALEAQRYLIKGEPKKAIDILQERSKRLPGSKLYTIESRAYLFLGNLKKALSKAWIGIAACRNTQKEEAVDLALLISFINERKQNFKQALKAVDIAIEIAKQSGNPILELSSGLRQLRLLRVSQPLVSNTTLKPSILALAINIGPNTLASHPSLLRELAAELGQDEPEFIRWASNILLEGLLQSLPNEEIINILRSLSNITFVEEEWMINADHTELLKLAKHRIEELLYSELNNSVSKASSVVQGLFQKSIDDIFYKGFFTINNSYVKRDDSNSLPPMWNQENQLSLVNIIAEYPEDVLHRITRFQLRSDFSNLRHGKDTHSVAAEIVDRAIKMGKINEVIEDFKQSASSKTHKKFFGSFLK